MQEGREGIFTLQVGRLTMFSLTTAGSELSLLLAGILLLSCAEATVMCEATGGPGAQTELMCHCTAKPVLQLQGAQAATELPVRPWQGDWPEVHYVKPASTELARQEVLRSALGTTAVLRKQPASQT